MIYLFYIININVQEKFCIKFIYGMLEIISNMFTFFLNLYLNNISGIFIELHLGNFYYLYNPRNFLMGTFYTLRT